MHRIGNAPVDDKRMFFTGKNETEKVVDELLIGEEQRIYYTGERPAKLLKRIKKAFKFIEAAGGLVKNNKEEFLFIYRLDKWDLPKGKAEKGETPAETALREVVEETGLDDVALLQPLANTYHIYPLKDIMVLKCTYWYEMEHKGEGKVIPQTTENITSVEWIAKDQFPKVVKNTYPSILEVIHSI